MYGLDVEQGSTRGWDDSQWGQGMYGESERPVYDTFDHQPSRGFGELDHNQSYRSPLDSRHLGVSDEDWNEAREELVGLANPGRSGGPYDDQSLRGFSPDRSPRYEPNYSTGYDPREPDPSYGSGNLDHQYGSERLSSSAGYDARDPLPSGYHADHLRTDYGSGRFSNDYGSEPAQKDYGPDGEYSDYFPERDTLYRGDSDFGGRPGAWGDGLASPGIRDGLYSHHDSSWDRPRDHGGDSSAVPILETDPYHYHLSSDPGPSSSYDTRDSLHSYPTGSQSERGFSNVFQPQSGWSAGPRRSYPDERQYSTGANDHLQRSSFERSFLDNVGRSAPRGTSDVGSLDTFDLMGRDPLANRAFDPLEQTLDQEFGRMHGMMGKPSASPKVGYDRWDTDPEPIEALGYALDQYDLGSPADARTRPGSPGRRVQRDRIDHIRAQLDESLARSSATIASHGPTFPSAFSAAADRAQMPRTQHRSPGWSLHGEHLRGPSMRARTPGTVGRSGSLAAHQASLTHNLNQIGQINEELRRSDAARQRELACASQQVAQFAQESITQELRHSDVVHQREHQRELAELAQHSAVQAAGDAEIFRELDRQRAELNRQRCEISRDRSRADAQAQLSSLDRQLHELDRQREIDGNRQLANLSRFGHLPSVLNGSYGGQPLASPYLQQSRFLTAARRWSVRDNRHSRTPAVYDHVDAWYKLMSEQLPKHLPMLKDPYYDSRLSGIKVRTGLNSVAPIGSRGSMGVGLGLGMGNPFTDGIDYDYGYGRVGALGLHPERFEREAAHALDDLYLFELLLRVDQSIDERERERLWSLRLRWDEHSSDRLRVESWRRMAGSERRRLGLGEGSYWASRLFGIPLSAHFGYTRAIDRTGFGPAGTSYPRTHYGLTPTLRARYPMWSRGGLGLGRRISTWYEGMPKPIKLKYLLRQEEIRRDYAERRGEIPPRPPVRGPGLMGTGRGGSGGGLNGMRKATSRTFGQHLNLLTPAPPMGISSLTSGLGLNRDPAPDRGGTGGLSRASGGLGPVPSTSKPALGRRSSLPGPMSSGKPSTSAQGQVPPKPAGTGHKSHPAPANPVRVPPQPTNAPTKPVHVPPRSSTTAAAPPKLAAPAPIHGASSNAKHSTQTLPVQKPIEARPADQTQPTTPSRVSNGRTTSPIERATTPGVVFNPHVRRIPAETEDDPRPEPRPPSRTSMRPSRSAMKTPPADVRKHAIAVGLDDEQRLESITKINTDRNRATPAPPEEDSKGNHTRAAN